MLRFILTAVILFGGCAGGSLLGPHPVREIAAQTERDPRLTPTPVRTPALHKKSDGTFLIPTVYWATPQGAAARGWSAVFGGTVVEVKGKKEKLGDFPREFVSGKLKVEKVFRNFPDNSEIAAGSLLESEDFDGLRKGDKVIIFIHHFYEGSFVRAEVAGTNSKLGFKIGDWSDPLVAAVEKVAACDKLREAIDTSPPDDYRVKTYACGPEQAQLILDDPEIARVWKRSDPEGFRALTEMRESERLEK